MRPRNAFKYSVFEASKLVSTKTLLLKHYYRRQGREAPYQRKSSENILFVLRRLWGRLHRKGVAIQLALKEGSFVKRVVLGNLLGWHVCRTKLLPKKIQFDTKGLSGPVLRDTARLSQRYPPIARYGVFGVSTWPIGCDTPSPFSESFPCGEHAKRRCDTPS